MGEQIVSESQSSGARGSTATVGGPTKSRYITSYAARRVFKDAIQFPPDVTGVQDAIDIHCHAHEGQQDALALAKHASKSGMRGILFKTIVGRKRPAEAVRKVRAELASWCEDEGAEPVNCWAGWMVADSTKPPSLEATREQLEDGVTAVWMPVTMHANTLNKVGGRAIWFDPTADRTA